MKKLLIVLFIGSIAVAVNAQVKRPAFEIGVENSYLKTSLLGDTATTDSTRTNGEEFMRGVSIQLYWKFDKSKSANQGIGLGAGVREFSGFWDTLAISKNQWHIGVSYFNCGYLTNSNMNIDNESYVGFLLEDKVTDNDLFSKQVRQKGMIFEEKIQIFKDFPVWSAFFSHTFKGVLLMPLQLKGANYFDGEVVNAPLTKEDSSMFLYDVSFKEKIFSLPLFKEKVGLAPTFEIGYSNMFNASIFQPMTYVKFGLSLDSYKTVMNIFSIEGVYRGGATVESWGIYGKVNLIAVARLFSK